jgi:ADP-ribose pyrophosphatase YjhB (NUDIX family)
MAVRKEHSAGGVVVRGGKLLLVRVENLQNEKVWCLPKGHLEKGESAEEAAVREVTEETGWKCRSLGPILTVGYSFVRNGRRVSKKVDWFALKAQEKVGEPDESEVFAVKWAPLGRAREFLTYPTDIEALEKWEKECRRQ